MQTAGPPCPHGPAHDNGSLQSQVDAQRLHVGGIIGQEVGVSRRGSRETRTTRMDGDNRHKVIDPVEVIPVAGIHPGAARVGDQHGSRAADM